MLEPHLNAANGATKNRKGQEVLAQRPREINKLNMQTAHRLACRRSRRPKEPATKETILG